MLTAETDPIHAALERALQCERLVDLVHEQEAEQETQPIIDTDRTDQLERACDQAVSEESDARDGLVGLITERVGQAPWTVLVAGHIVCLTDRADCLTIVPIENVVRLDDLRRFP